MMTQRWRTAGGLLAGTVFAFSMSATDAQATEGELLTGVGPVEAARVDVRMNERWIEVPGTATIIHLWDERSPDGTLSPHYAISLDGESFAISRGTSYEIGLRRAKFDPMTRAPHLPANLTAGSDNDLYLVQFLTQPLEVYQKSLSDLGADLYQFVANHSYVVRMDDQSRSEVSELPFVRWVGAFHPYYKVDEQVLPLLLDDEYAAQAEGMEGRFDDAANVLGADQPEAADARTYNIVVFKEGPDQKQIVARRIRDLGGRVDNLIPDGYRMVATLTPDQLMGVLRLSEVGWVQPWMPPEHDMDVAREIGGANYIETTIGMTGQGVRAEVMDNGIRHTHQEFQDPPVLFHGGSRYDSHGTSTYGINFASGVNAAARGMVPDAEAKIFAVWQPPNRYSHTDALVDPNGPYRGVYQSNSWGSGRTTYYDAYSQEMDNIIFNLDLIITQSQSNAGSRDSRPQAWAKNIVSVGGVYHYNTLSTSDDRWSYGASIGPANDGRIKPDFTHFYDWIFTTAYNSDSSYTSTFGGTSGATPIVAGHFGIAFQMWHEQIFPGFGGGQNVFDSKPHFSTIKALLINTADEYPFSGSFHDLTRVHQGWGLPDLENLYSLRDELFIIDETELLEPMDSRAYNFDVSNGTPAFRATLVYNDPPGAPYSNPNRINDLTLKVTSPSGTVYWGNNGLLDGNYSTPAGVANTIDTVENVFIQSPETGTWQVEVIGTEINQDSHVETGALDADFALVVTGGIGEEGMLLDVPTLIGGQMATLTVSNATAGRNVYYVYSLTGTGSTPVPQLNVTLGLANPSLAGSAAANQSGVAELTDMVPNVGPRVLWLQAAEYGRTSNVVLTQIN